MNKIEAMQSILHDCDKSKIKFIGEDLDKYQFTIESFSDKKFFVIIDKEIIEKMIKDN